LLPAVLLVRLCLPSFDRRRNRVSELCPAEQQQQPLNLLEKLLITTKKTMWEKNSRQLGEVGTA
jgi:hypothetical protein